LKLAMLAILAVAAVAQSVDAFEVATVKPAESSSGRWIRMRTAHQFEARNHTLKTLIQAAYNLPPSCVSGGPAWVDSERYDILAKSPGAVRPTLDEQMAMLRALLADRFQLTFHRGEKEMAIYTLTIARPGAKLKESAEPLDALPQGPPPLVFVLSPESARLPGKNATIAELASVLQRTALDRPVIDKTGLTSRFDFELEWTPEESQFGGAGIKGTAESSKPDLFAALQQQLGLKLEASRGMVATLIVDRAEHPSQN
jgi:uncharacterized protein (TIGR03435 family)